MIEKIIDACTRNRFLVFTGVLLLMLAGVYAVKHIPLDAIPDISDVQVIVYTPWEGRSPDLIEDQVTYPIVSALISAPKVKTVRGLSDFGFSYVYVIFEDGTDIYWARSRVLEYLQQITAKLPEGAAPVLGPDATGVGWVFTYALVDESGRHDLAYLRTLPGLVSALRIGQRRGRLGGGQRRGLCEAVPDQHRPQPPFGLRDFHPGGHRPRQGLQR